MSGTSMRIELSNDCKYALEIVMKQPPKNAIAYAQTYADALLGGRVPMTPEAVSTQLLYILGNLNNWRGLISKDVKRILREEQERLSRMEAA